MTPPRRPLTTLSILARWLNAPPVAPVPAAPARGSDLRPGGCQLPGDAVSARFDQERLQGTAPPAPGIRERGLRQAGALLADRGRRLEQQLLAIRVPRQHHGQV